METKGRFSKDEARLDSIETHCTNMSVVVQVGQLVTDLKNQQKEKFPSDTELNPKDHCKTITYKSGKEVESFDQKKKKRKEAELEVEVERERARRGEANRSI